MERLRGAGLAPRVGHDADAVPPDAEVVVSTAVPEDNPELARARERGQPILHRGELLAQVCERKRLLAVAGTHGKTTTAGMLAHVLRAIGADPGFLLGGELPGAGNGGEAANAGWGEGDRGPSCSTPFVASATRLWGSRCPPTAPFSPWSAGRAWSVLTSLARDRGSSWGFPDVTTC
jgi:UDP-N-acetylmuramate--alanine ligase